MDNINTIMKQVFKGQNPDNSLVTKELANRALSEIDNIRMQVSDNLLKDITNEAS